MVNTFNQMQQEAFRIQKDMYIRIQDLKLLDLSENKIYEIMKKSGASKKIINNLLDGRFTPVNYSKPRFETKVRTDRKSTRLNSSHGYISYAVFCLKKKKKNNNK